VQEDDGFAALRGVDVSLQTGGTVLDTRGRVLECLHDPALVSVGSGAVHLAAAIVAEDVVVEIDER